jgi:hypothetical protein
MTRRYCFWLSVGLTGLNHVLQPATSAEVKWYSVSTASPESLLSKNVKVS